MDRNITKRAVTYSLLAHIRNTSTLSNGTLDIFVPIVKKALHKISRELNKSNSILDIHKIILDDYNIDIPLPTLKKMLSLVASELNKEKEVFCLYNDDSYLIKNFIFEDFDEAFQKSKEDVNSIQELYKVFCKIHSIKKDNTCVFSFIEKNQSTLGGYLVNKTHTNGNDYSIEARFVEYYKVKNPEFYESIRNIYLGSILVTYLEYKPSNLGLEVDLLFDTNFIISLLDLNTPESTHTCEKLLEICSGLGFTFHLLSDTIEEISRLIRYKAEDLGSSSFPSLQTYISKEDILNACFRRKLSKNDLERIADNIEDFLGRKKIAIVYKTDKYKNIARFSTLFKRLKKHRNTDTSALHDATCITYVKEMRKNKLVKDFNSVNCWFVNNSVSHEFNNLINSSLNQTSQFQPESIKANDLLNILWLSSPQINSSNNNDILDIGLTSLISCTLNQSLPKANVIRELEDNIQKYRNDDISDRDIYLLSSRITEGNLNDIEKINELSISNPTAFNKRLKEEAEKQEKLESERNQKVDNAVTSYKIAVKDITNRKSKLDKKFKDSLAKGEEELKSKLADLARKTLIVENRDRTIKRDILINKQLRKWRITTWFWCMIIIISLVAALIYFSTSDSMIPYLMNMSKEKLCGIIWKIIIPIVTLIFSKVLYDVHLNHGNIDKYISKIKIPDELKELQM